MAKVRYKRLSQSDVKKALGGPQGPIYADLARRGQRVVNQAKRLAPVDNGTLRNSITMELLTRGGRPLVRVGTNVKYARYVHDGTGLYGPRRQRIVARNGGVMRWPVRGSSPGRRSKVPGRGRIRTKSLTPTSFAYARWTRGMKGTPFLKDALPKGLGKSYVRLPRQPS